MGTLPQLLSPSSLHLMPRSLAQWVLVFMYVDGCAYCKHVRSSVHIWRPEVTLKYIPHHSLLYSFETGLSLTPKPVDSARLERAASPRDLPGFALPALGL